MTTARASTRARRGSSRPGSSTWSALSSATLRDRPWPGLGGVEVTGITLDSRAVRPGDLYAALPGARTHGADFVAAGRRRPAPSPC